MSLGTFNNLNDSSVHLDILKRFAKDHEVWLVCKNEDKPTKLTKEARIHVLRVHTGQLKKIGLIKKGINTIKVEPQFKNAIKKHLSNVKFDLVLYTTPPITFASAVNYIKKRDNAVTYLMLKDIFPQNAVDIGMMSTTGIRGFLYYYFRKKEKELYRCSDYIGCMSPANCEYIIKNNPEVNKNKVEICPNSIEVIDKSVDKKTRNAIRMKYGIPLDKIVFVYGGNLGRPQGIPFLIKCLHKCKDIDNVFFLIVGEGTEYGRLENYVNKYHQKNLKLMKRLPKEDYDTMVAACDVGMIFLDHRFTIPNFPSRLLGYMQAKLPVLAVTDPNTDIGKVIVDGEFGWWCESNDSNRFVDFVKTIISIDSLKMKDFKNNSYQYLELNYSTSKSYNKVIEHF